MSIGSLEVVLKEIYSIVYSANIRLPFESNDLLPTWRSGVFTSASKQDRVKMDIFMITK